MSGLTKTGYFIQSDVQMQRFVILFFLYFNYPQYNRNKKSLKHFLLKKTKTPELFKIIA